jgi:hypothetical protein
VFSENWITLHANGRSGLPCILSSFLLRVRQAILPLTDYYNAVGAVTDAVLLQMVDEIIDLDDITEVESEKLAEMCKQMEPVQDLFNDSEGRVGLFNWV